MDREIKLKGLTFDECKTLFPKDVFLAGYMGSIAHGTYILNSDPNSVDDKDVMMVYIKDIEYYLGLRTGRDVREYKKNEWDIVGYEIQKYFHLLLKSNPNVMSLLWLPEKYYLVGNELSWILKKYRDVFVSKKAYHSFTGYAYSQLKRMEHYKFEGYMGEKRKQLVERFGYDTKNASHLIRLLRMGIEFLTEGKLFVEREDAPQLISIKRGEWELKRIKEEADSLFKKAQEAYIHSKLPSEPNYEKADLLLKNIIARYHDLNIVNWEELIDRKSDVIETKKVEGD